MLIFSLVFALYEQIEPSDGFGLVMQRHFNQMSIPLLSLPSYPGKDSQKKRFEERVLKPMLRLKKRKEMYFNIIYYSGLDELRSLRFK